MSGPVLARAHRDDDWIRVVERVQIRRGDLFDGQALKKCGRCEHVPVLLDHHGGLVEYLDEQPPQRSRGERPEPRVFPLASIDLTDPRRRHEHYASGRQRAVKRAHRGTHVVHQLQRLRQHDAIVRVGWQHIRVGQITHDGRARVAAMHVQDVNAGYPVGAKPACVAIVADLEYAPADRRGIPCEKTLDVVPVDWLTAIEPEIPADRSGSTQIMSSTGLVP